MRHVYKILRHWVFIFSFILCATLKEPLRVADELGTRTGEQDRTPIAECPGSTEANTPDTTSG